MMDVKFVLAGLLVGSLIGLTGMGGGSVMTPLLLFMGLHPQKAVVSDLLYAAVTKTLGTARHARQKRVDWGAAGWLAVGSVPASVVGVIALSHVAKSGQNNGLLKQIIAVMLLLVGVSIVVRTFRKRSAPVVEHSNEPLQLTTRRKAILIGVGVVGGFGVGFTSIGSGTLFALALMTLFPLSATRIVGTDTFHATMLVWAASLANIAIGHFQINTVVWLLAGSLPGVWIGSHYTGRVPERPLRTALACTLLLSGTLLLTV